MPRNEGFLDPDAGPLASFAFDLRALREKAGKVPYRVLAKRAGFCASTLSVAASGSKLPSLDVTLAYVQACGAEPEEWQERWHALAAQHQPVHAAANGHSGLEFAPPYDADEHGEPALFDAVPLDLPQAGSLLDTSASTDREVPVPDDAAGDYVSATHHDEPRSRAALQFQLQSQPVAPAVPAVSGQLHGDPWRRPRRPIMSIGRVTTAALTVATAILGLKVVASEGTGSPAVTSSPLVSARPADTPMQQANALYALIYQSTSFRSDANDAIWDVDSCRNLSNAQSKLRDYARKRQEQVEQLAKLDVSKVPDHEQLAAALKLVWITSSQTDFAYANIAADLQTACTSGAIKTDPNYQQADTDAQKASTAKREAAKLWNANADGLGQLQILESQF